MDLFQHRTVRELAGCVDRCRRRRGPRRLLHELTTPMPAGAATLSLRLRAVRRRQRRGLPAAGRRAAGRARAVVAGHPRPRRRPGRGTRCLRRAGRPRAPPRSWSGSTARSSCTGTAGSAARSPSSWPAGWRPPAGSCEAVYIGGDVPVRPARTGLCAGAGASRLRAAARQPHVRELAQAHGRRPRRAGRRSRPTGSSATCGATPEAAEEYFTELLDRRRRAAARPDHLASSATRDPATDYYAGALPRSGSSSPTPPRWWCSTRPGTSSSSTGPTELAEIVTRCTRRWPGRGRLRARRPVPRG